MDIVSKGEIVELGGYRGGVHDLAVGCFASTCRTRLGERLLAFARRHPQVNVGVQEMPRASLLPALAKGELSLAIVPGPAQPGFERVALWTDRVVVALAPSHPLAAEPMLTTAQLRDQAVLVSRRQHRSEVHRFLSNCILPLGPALNGPLLDVSRSSLIARVRAGEGIALVCASESEEIDAGVTLREIDTPCACFPVHAYWRDADPEWPLSALIEALREA